MNPNTGTCPIFRSKRDAEINKAIYRRVPVLIREGEPDANPWGISFHGHVHMAKDSGLFRTANSSKPTAGNSTATSSIAATDAYLPFTKPRWSTISTIASAPTRARPTPRPTKESSRSLTRRQHADPDRVSLPWYWVPEEEFEERLDERWDRRWLLGWRDVCRNTDTRTVIAGLLPEWGWS